MTAEAAALTGLREGTPVVTGAGDLSSAALGSGVNARMMSLILGTAGQLLDDMMEIIDLNREKVYIANIVKCRPPRNRDPLREEAEACQVWLERQIALVNPHLIVCLGRIAATYLIHDSFRITREHGRWFPYGERKILATFHPSALLRDPSRRPEAFMDLREIRREYRAFLPSRDALSSMSV